METIIVRSTLTPDWIELVTASRNEFVTQMTMRRAEFHEPAYADLLNEIQAADFEGYVDIETLELIPETGQAPFLLDLSLWPEGTKMRVSNENGDQIIHEDRVTSLSLVDTGEYVIEVAPPLPYHSYKFELRLS